MTRPHCWYFRFFRAQRVLCNQRLDTTTANSCSGRATLSDARALLTREIQKIRQGPCDAVVDTSIDEDGLYESSIARMSNSLSRRVDFGELDLPAHLSLLERRAFGLRQICFSIALSLVLLALLHRFVLFACSPESNFYLWMVNVMLGYRRRMMELRHDPLPQYNSSSEVYKISKTFNRLILAHVSEYIRWRRGFSRRDFAI